MILVDIENLYVCIQDVRQDVVPAIYGGNQNRNNSVLMVLLHKLYFHYQ